MKTKLFVAGAFALALLTLTAGCTSASRDSLEKYLFTTSTNLVPRVVSTTNIVGNEMIVTVQTNLTPFIEVAPSPQAQAWATAASSIAEMFAPGVGKLTLLGTTGALGIYGVTRRRKLNDTIAERDELDERQAKMSVATETLAQTMEVFREVLKATPQGQALNARLTDLMIKNQMTAGVLREVAQVVAATVDNDKAKRAAQLLLETLPSAQTPAT